MRSEPFQPVAHVVLCRRCPSGYQLCLHRREATGFMDGYWVLPGGRIDSGEEATEAAYRELFEEWGVKAPRLTLVAQLSYETNGAVDPFGAIIERCGSNFVFLAEKWQGVPRAIEPHLHGSPAFFDIHQLPTPVPVWVQDVANQLECGSSVLVKHYREVIER